MNSRYECFNCLGTGVIAGTDCSVCKGLGWTSKPRYTPGDRQAKAEIPRFNENGQPICIECDGEGTVDGVECKNCVGKGWTFVGYTPGKAYIVPKTQPDTALIAEFEAHVDKRLTQYEDLISEDPFILANLMSKFPYTLDDGVPIAGGPINRRLAFELAEILTADQAKDMIRFMRAVASYIDAGSGRKPDAS